MICKGLWEERQRSCHWKCSLYVLLTKTTSTEKDLVQNGSRTVTQMNFAKHHSCHLSKVSQSKIDAFTISLISLSMGLQCKDSRP